MKSALFLLLLSLACFAGVRAEEEAVITLDASNFDAEIAKHDFLVVEFYAPWCGHCKALAPEYEKAAAELKTLDPPIYLAKVDAADDKNKNLSEKYEIRGFPTLKIFRKGKEPVEYDGPREAEGIVKYVMKQAGPATSLVTSADDMALKLKEDDVVIVGAFAEGSAEYTTFVDVAEALRADLTFFHTFDSTILPEGKKESPSVTVFKSFDEGVVTYGGDLKDVDAMKKFIEESSVPVLIPMDEAPAGKKHLQKAFSVASRLKVMTYAPKSVLEGIKTALYSVAKAHRDYDFIVGPSEENSHALQFFGLSADSPCMVVYNLNGGSNYVKQPLLESEVAAWFKSYLNGDVKPHVKSEEPPADNSAPVKIVTAKTFAELVTEAKKTVLIEFYAPWCGHCKKLAPVYEEVGEEFVNDPTVTIAKMDATANDIPDERFEVKGFPSLYLMTVSGEIKKYEGDRSKESLIDFVKGAAPESKGEATHEEL